jgi:hypothetical protein
MGAAYYFGGIVKEDVAMLGDAGFEVSESRQVRMALIRYNVTRASSKTETSPSRSLAKTEPTTQLSPLDESLLTEEAEVLTPPEIAVLRHWAEQAHQSQLSDIGIENNAGNMRSTRGPNLPNEQPTEEPRS